jgi:hypothetical protein
VTVDRPISYEEMVALMGADEGIIATIPRRDSSSTSDSSSSSASTNSSAIVTRVADVERERVRWLWEGRIPRGKITLIDGDPCVGKSTLTLDLAARVTTGAPWPDGSLGCDPGSVVLFSAEDGIADTIRPRLEAANADLQRVLVFEGMRLPTRSGEFLERPPVLPLDVDQLRDVIVAENVALVIVDPLMAFLSDKVDSYRDQSVRSALLPFARLAEETGVAIAVVRHLSKSGGTHAMYRGGGSIGIIGAARIAMLAAIDPENESGRVLAMVKSNLAAFPPSLAYRLVNDKTTGAGRIEWLGETTHTAGQLLTETENDDERSTRDEAAEWLRDVLQPGPLRATEVKAAARRQGIAERTLDRARARAGATSRRVGFGRDAHYMWQLEERRQ